MASRTASVASISFSPDGLHMAWLSSDGYLRVWDGRGVSPALQMASSRFISFGDSVIAVSDATKPVVRFVDPGQMKIMKEVSSAVNECGTVIALTPPRTTSGSSRTSSYDGFYAFVFEQSVTIRSYLGKTVATWNHGTVAFCASFSSCLKYLAMGDNQGRIACVNFLKQPPKCVTVKAHKSFVSSLEFSADGKILVSGGWDGRAHVWKVEDDLTPVSNIRAEWKPGDKLHAVTIQEMLVNDTRDMLIATGGSNGVVRVWNLHTSHERQRGRKDPEPLATHEAHSSSIYALSFSIDGRHVASGSADGTVRLFGVPSKPVLVSHPTSSRQGQGEFRDTDVEGTYHVQPMDLIMKGQRADRVLIFCPSNIVTLTCPICTEAYDSQSRVPICSGVCGHTFACKLCNETLWEANTRPRCPECRSALIDIAPNYELLRVLSAAKGDKPYSSSASRSPPRPHLSPMSTVAELSRDDYVDLKRLTWIEVPETAYMTCHSCVIYNGTMDGEAVAIRVPSAASSREQLDGTRVSMTETERHIKCLKKLRGPHIVQLYGVSRTAAPDNRVIVISDVPCGGTLESNLISLRQNGRSLPAESIVALSLQIVKTVRFLHESDTSAGWSLSPKTIGLAMSLQSDRGVLDRLKLVEMGGSLFKSECSTDVTRTFPADYVAYMAPEMLDEDRSGYDDRDVVFRKLCQADMYSVGVLLWELCSGGKPFDGLRPAQVVAAVVGRGERPGFVPLDMPEQLQTLIGRLWSRRPDDRPSAEEACAILETVPSAPLAL